MCFDTMRIDCISDRILRIVMVKFCHGYITLLRVQTAKIVVWSTASRARSLSSASVRGLSVSNDAAVLWIA